MLCYVVCGLLQELVDSARRLLDGNTSQLQQLCARSGFTPPDDKGVHQAYDAAVKEWEGQMLQRVAGVCLLYRKVGALGAMDIAELWCVHAVQLLARHPPPPHLSTLHTSLGCHAAWQLHGSSMLMWIGGRCGLQLQCNGKSMYVVMLLLCCLFAAACRPAC
jgi:hypothetical protein